MKWRDNEDTTVGDDPALVVLSGMLYTLDTLDTLAARLAQADAVSSATSSSSSRCAKTRWPNMTRPASPEE